MKKVLGLDLGSASIGWALIEEENESKKNIIGMGSRIMPLSVDDKNEFISGNAISKNQKRTKYRTQRKGYFRYKLRRANLIEKLKKNNMLPDENFIKLSKTELWRLRSKSVDEKIGLQEFGRVLLHLNQKRGYKSSRSEANMDKKDTEYVSAVKSRHEKLKETHKTIGQFFYQELQKNDNYRIKEQVYPREAYIEEFNAICINQKKYYPDIITEDFISEIRDEIIYYQRNLKSQKSLVSVCEFEGFFVKKMKKNILLDPKWLLKVLLCFNCQKFGKLLTTLN